MINPDDVTQFDASKDWKEEFLLFCACVAGKGAFQQAKKLDEFIKVMYEGYFECFYTNFKGTLFELLLSATELEIDQNLREVKMGQYARLVKVFKTVATFDVDTVTLEQLESVPGIGPKTARFFLTHTRPNQKFAILDTHILSHLRDLQSSGVESLVNLGYTIPKSTPSGNKYKAIEKVVLDLVTASGLSNADWDLQVWKSRRHL